MNEDATKIVTETRLAFPLRCRLCCCLLVASSVWFCHWLRPTQAQTMWGLQYRPGVIPPQPNPLHQEPKCTWFGHLIITYTQQVISQLYKMKNEDHLCQPVKLSS